MTTLDSIVNLTITTTTQSVSRAGFGTPLLVAYFSTLRFAARTKVYSSLTEMVSDGFTVNDPAYLMASAVFAQNPKVSQVKLGRRALAPSQAATFTPVNLDEGYVHQIVVRSPDGTTTTCSYTNDATATVAEATAALQTALDAIAGLTATDNSTNVSVVADTAGDLFFFDVPSDGGLTIKNTTTDPGIATDLAAIYAADPDWYGMAIDSNSEAEINAAATWILSNGRKLFVANCSGLEITVIRSPAPSAKIVGGLLRESPACSE